MASRTTQSSNLVITLLANDSPSPLLAQYCVQPVPAERIDPGLVKRWISTCDNDHADRCKVHPAIKEFLGAHLADVVQDFRSIDVNKNCLVRVNNGARYVTLSYVWGRRPFSRTLMSTVNELEKPGALAKPEVRDHIPQTIKNAMEMTKLLDIPYLYIWVDSICIVQDGTTGRKLETIKNMRLVYSASYLVIIAVSGADAFSGIPGVQFNTLGARQPVKIERKLKRAQESPQYCANSFYISIDNDRNPILTGRA
ncbi:heterokaryon incompatibility protein-domain-containing protein [Stachybotrys elegans]|uniref:Heterokaryon incompatibility protein-domain-containing protein n=1 Tax=Stachybotrys elegans TaxID=80388 RepID=A0A8K0WU55_9HYPO|nr:heterokaryon incompatibility protein-domain-containing protein [Stachybotrys elegans]